MMNGLVPLVFKIVLDLLPFFVKNLEKRSKWEKQLTESLATYERKSTDSKLTHDAAIEAENEAKRKAKEKWG